jgi:hypothetical protein
VIALLRRWLCPDLTTEPHCIDWLFDPDDDNDEESAQGWNDPTGYEPGDDEEDQ